MPSTFSTNKGLELQASGENAGTWGAPKLNDDLSMVDRMFGTVANVALTNANHTMTFGTPGSPGEAQAAFIVCSGALTADAALIFPAGKGGFYTIDTRGITSNPASSDFCVGVAAGGTEVIFLPRGHVVDIYINGSTNNVRFRNLSEPGTYKMFAYSATPRWITGCTIAPYLLCDSSVYSSSTFPTLFEILGTTTLPDLRGRSLAGLNLGTGRITAAGSGIDGATRFSAGGFENITLDITMIPAHAHGVTDPQHVHPLTNGTLVLRQAGGGNLTTTLANSLSVDTITVNAASTGISIQNSGGGLAHNNMPPACIGGLWFIKT